ncbi:hypothetical protein L1987_45752 [Smallanthus sonchifolius]|uniref:Uncharacterized protein n=1 Tax=Smallanthus sonchifolius TaxID=185202 RepID=A0ACB9FZI3_9ASTR|nr:hypothetical protein L1987_45752 [Smallanthus sonchifolius]
MVAAVGEEVGTAGALRAIAHHLTASDILVGWTSHSFDILVVSGDLVCDVSPGAVAAAHRRHDTVVTALFCAAPISGPPESGSSSGNDKTKKPVRHNIVGLDLTQQFLLYIAAGEAFTRGGCFHTLRSTSHRDEEEPGGNEVEKDIKVQKSILRAVGKVNVTCTESINLSVLQQVLNQKQSFRSLKQDVLPYLVKTQLRSEILLNGAHVEENGNEKDGYNTDKVMLSQLLANASTPSFHEVYALGPNGFSPAERKTHKCCVYIASKTKYCARLSSIQAYSDINRDVIGDASHLSGCSFSVHNNVIHPSAVLGSKTTAVHWSRCCSQRVLSWSNYDFLSCGGIFDLPIKFCRRIIQNSALESQPEGLKGQARKSNQKSTKVKAEVGQLRTSPGPAVDQKRKAQKRLDHNACWGKVPKWVVNSVIMNHVTIGDGCSIQGSIISSNVQLQERAVLKDCQIGAGFVVTAGSEYKGESLARK